MSALLLQYPIKRYELSDDLESFIHFISYFAVRYHKSNLSRSKKLKQFVDWYYFESEIIGDRELGGSSKLWAIKQGNIGFDLCQAQGWLTWSRG